MEVEIVLHPFEMTCGRFIVVQSMFFEPVEWERLGCDVSRFPGLFRVWVRRLKSLCVFGTQGPWRPKGYNIPVRKFGKVVVWEQRNCDGILVALSVQWSRTTGVEGSLGGEGWARSGRGRCREFSERSGLNHWDLAKHPGPKSSRTRKRRKNYRSPKKRRKKS